MVLNDSTSQGVLLVVSGPSGTGKGTICDIIRSKKPKLGYSVSCTTRKPRVGEVEGQSYFFKTEEEFETMIDKEELLEYAEVYGNYYGTPKEYVMNMLNMGYDILLEIDIQGALQIKKRYPQCVLVFIAPPSIDELYARLKKRGTDSPAVVERRMKAAEDELKYADKYDYLIVNNVAEEAADQIIAVMGAERNRVLRNLFVVENLLAD